MALPPSDSYEALVSHRPQQFPGAPNVTHNHVNPATSPDREALNMAIQDVVQTLASKGETWTHMAPLFENFEIMEEFDIDPLRFGLAMCRLKMNRLKSCFRRNGSGYGMASDPDARDSLRDLASFAILCMAISEKLASSTPVNRIAR